MSERVIWQSEGGALALVDLGDHPYYTARQYLPLAHGVEERFRYDLLCRDGEGRQWRRLDWNKWRAVYDALSALIDYFGAYVTAHPGDIQMDDVEAATLERRVLDCVAREDFAGAQDANNALLRLHFSSRDEKEPVALPQGEPAAWIREHAWSLDYHAAVAEHLSLHPHLMTLEGAALDLALRQNDQRVDASEMQEALDTLAVFKKARQ